MTRRTRRLSLFALPAGLLVVFVIAVWLLWPRTAITRENAAKIKLGMTLSEVEAILGDPARDETTGHVITLDDDGFVRLHAHPPFWKPSAVWWSDSVVVLLEMDDEGRVWRYDAIPVCRARGESSLDLLRRWLRL